MKKWIKLTVLVLGLFLVSCNEESLVEGYNTKEFTDDEGGSNNQNGGVIQFKANDLQITTIPTSNEAVLLSGTDMVVKGLNSDGHHIFIEMSSFLGTGTYVISEGDNSNLGHYSDSVNNYSTSFTGGIIGQIDVTAYSGNKISGTFSFWSQIENINPPAPDYVQITNGTFTNVSVTTE